MNKDREFIKELFDNDGIKAPESLSEENMLAMLEKADAAQATPAAQEKQRKELRPSGTIVRRAMGIAAALLVAVFGISGFVDIVSRPPDTTETGNGLYTFSSEREITKLLESMDGGVSGRIRPNFGDAGDIMYETAPEDSAATDSAASDVPAAGLKSAASSDQSHSETYLQVEGIDEADIVKTDGRYIYFVNDSKEVIIYSASEGKTEKVSVIGAGETDNYVDNIYIAGDRLITVGRYYKDDGPESCSGVVVYDISDIRSPKELYDFSQSGSILSSRMVGDQLYLVTNDYVYRGGRAVPLCGGFDSLKDLPASDICCVPDPKTASYLVLSAIDISKGSQGKAATKAILGVSDTIYCNDHSLYSISEEWDDKTDTSCTRIVRASLDGLKVKFTASATVSGYAVSQFAMDEKDGYFRIATTSERAGIAVNNLYVLDSGLKPAGSVNGFARNESIKAVRYVGDKAYVITYEAIDPLFIIDLSDPEKPVIEGEVKIDGFSTLLIPAGSGRLLGIGHATGDNGYGGEYESGLKLALFDISDPSHPAVLDSKEFKDMSSQAQFDHHALMVNAERGFYAIPYSVDNYGDVIIDDDLLTEGEEELTDNIDGQDHEGGVLVFSAGDSIKVLDRHALKNAWPVRNVQIGDWIYAVDYSGDIQSFRPEI